MRLTLRTLLAYLDDTLDPQQTKEMGKKIQESPRAAELVSRIREVIRRRRLGAPDVAGPSQGIDPNIVAQYLDNTLEAEQVAEFEAVCLDSDLLLAEVAAIHQILTLVPADGAEIDSRSRERYLALGPVGADAQLQVPGTSPVTAKRVKPQLLAGSQADEIDAQFREGLPEYLKETPWAQRVAPAAGILFVIAASIIVLLLDRDLFKSLVPPQGAAPETVAPEVAAAPPDAAAPPGGPAPAPEPSKVPTVTVTPPAGQNPTMPPKGIDPTPPPDVPEPTVASALTVLPKPTVSTPANTTPLPPMPTEPPLVVEQVPMQLVDHEGVLLRYLTTDQHWYVHPRRGELRAGELYACPEPFEADFDIDKGAFRVTLLGDTAMEMLPPAEAARYRLWMRRGRVILHPAGDSPLPVLVQVKLGEQTFAVKFETVETTVAIEAHVQEPSGAMEPNPLRGTLYVIAGTAQVDDSGPLAGGRRFRLTSEPMDTLPTDANLWPAWLDAARRPTLSTLRRYSQLFEKEFDAQQAVDLSIPALIKDPRPKIAELGVRCLAITDSYAALAQALAQSEHEEARAAAADGLRQWLGTDAANRMILRRELEAHYPSDEVQAIDRLLWGYTKADAQDRLNSLELIEWLRSNHVEVRELAFGQLVQLTGRRYDYRPLGTVSQREAGVQRWLAHVQREGALIKPE